MLVSSFIENCSKYDNFQIWDVENIDSFLGGNGVFNEIFKHDYKMSVEEFSTRRDEVEESDMEIMKNLLDQIGDKHFLIFTHFDQNHQELIHMQDTKMMNFGIDISKIDTKHVFVLIMDKK